MRTWLLDRDLIYSAMCLDKRRLLAQLNENAVIFNTIIGESQGWKNHPTILMWKQHPVFFQYYHNIHWLVAKSYGIRLTTSYHKIEQNVELPYWWSDDMLFSNCRANLLFKEPDYYDSFCWEESPESEAYYPQIRLRGI